ncbi:MAG: apolipoprotein N-acyltransferase [Ignavibacteriaceae bacterium]
MGLSFPPLPFNFLVFFGLIPYLIVISQRDTLISINRATYLFAFIFSLLTIYWVGAFTEAKDPFLMIAGGFLLFANPILFLIPSTLYFWTRKYVNETLAIFLFPFFWVAYEYVSMSTDLRFPWILLGNSITCYKWFIQIADLVGVLGITLVIIYINIFLFKIYSEYVHKKKINICNGLVLLFFVTLPIIYSAIRIDDLQFKEDSIKIGLIQPNLDPYEKWSGGSIEQLNATYLQMSREAVSKGAAVIFFPETALPVYLLNGGYPHIVDSLINFVKLNDVFLLTGMPDLRFHGDKESAPRNAKYSEAGDFYYTTHNAIYLFSPNSREIQKYGKIKLVPFGEKTPFADEIPFLGSLIKWGVGLSGWNIGYDTSLFQLSYNDKIVKIFGAVCYESAFPDFVADYSGKGSNLIAVLTNDSWYGKTSGPYQHKEMGVLRAIENRKTVIRAANGGISCIIDPFGRTVAETGLFEKEILVGEVKLNDYKTFFTSNPRIIPSFAIAISVWIIGLMIMKRMKKKFNI